MNKMILPILKILSILSPTYLTELFGEPENDALRAADEAEAVFVFVLGDFAHEFSAMGAQALDDVLDVLDGEHDATYAEGIRWCVLRLNSNRCRRVKLAQLNLTVAVRGPQHRDLAANVLEPNDLVHKRSLEWHLTLQLHTKLEKELLRSLKVFDHDEDVVHPFKCHNLIFTQRRKESQRRLTPFAILYVFA